MISNYNMSTGSHYALAGGKHGADRLQVLSRVFAETTASFFANVNFQSVFSAVDLGCGIGSVTRTIAKCSPTRCRAVGLDADDNVICIARELNDEPDRVDFRTLDLATWDDSARYDLAYSRFLLHHVPNPQQLLYAAKRALNKNGILLVEDLHFDAHFCTPPSPAFKCYVALYKAIVEKNGGNANIGPSLVELLHTAGYVIEFIRTVQPAYNSGEGKDMAWLTLDGIASSVEQAGLCDRRDLDATLSELKEFTTYPTSIISLPRIFQIAARPK